MTKIRWRWAERDFGFRFKTGTGARAQEFYQGANNGDYYVVPASQRKLDADRFKELADGAVAPEAPKVVPNPWQNYDREWDWIQTADGICLNYAGCLSKYEIERREDEGVVRALELVSEHVLREEPVALSMPLIRKLHEAMFGDIYPFAGQWRTVSMHKGDGPTRWPYPLGGFDPILEVFERDVLSRSPLITDDDSALFAFMSEVMNELIAIHPFREGNGRISFVVGNLMLMQNGLLPIDVFNRRQDLESYYAACDAGRIHKDYKPLADLIEEWETETMRRWEETNG